MRVAEVMTTDIEFVDAGMTVQEAAITMGELSVGALPVGTADDLQGIVTDRDILFRVTAKGVDTATPIGDVMTTRVFSCRRDDAIETALDLMGARNVRRLPVLDSDGRMVGIVTLSDLSRVLLLSSHVIQDALHGLTAAQQA